MALSHKKYFLDSVSYNCWGSSINTYWKYFKLIWKYLRRILLLDRVGRPKTYCASINNVNFSAAGDLVTFSKLKVHYQTDYKLDTNLFTKETRTKPIKTLYENARDVNEPQVGVIFNRPVRQNYLAWIIPDTGLIKCLTVINLWNMKCFFIIRKLDAAKIWN